MIEKIRYFNDPEDSDYDYYAVIDKTSGRYMGGFSDPNHLHSLETTFKNVIPVGDTVLTYELVLIQITNSSEVERIRKLWDTPGETPYISDWHNYRIICESPINDAKGKSSNEKHITGIPNGYQKRASIAEIKNERPLEPVKDIPGTVIQNIFSSGKESLDPASSREDIDRRLTDERATQLRIVFRGEFVKPAKNRLIQCVRLDGKLIGRHLPKEDELKIECTFTDYCRGNQAYQIQLTNPNISGDGDGMINNSLIVEEV